MKSEIYALKVEMRTCLKSLRNHIAIILLIAILGYLVASLFTLRPIEDTYEATAAISATISAADAARNISLTAVFSDLMNSNEVVGKILTIMADDTITKKDLTKMLSAKAGNTQTILSITAEHRDPSMAVKAANAVTQVMASEAGDIYSFAGISVLDRASSASVAVIGNRVKIIIRVLGAMGAAALTCVYFIAMVLVSKKILSVEDCELDGELEVIGVIPFSVGK